MPTTAALFDLDGTLIDNMRFHALSWVELCRRLGIPGEQGFFERETAGKKNVEILTYLLGPGLPQTEVDRLADEKESIYRELYRPHLRPIPGAVAFLERLAARQVPCAVATLAPRANREMALGELGLSRFFQFVIGAEQTPRGKPAPDIYLAAAKAVGVAPERCVAFEDAVNGVVSAREAGVPVVALTTTVEPEALREAGARWIVRDFTELPGEVYEALGLGAAGQAA